MSAAFVNKLRELEKRLDEQREHNAELQNRIADLVARVAVIEAGVRSYSPGEMPRRKAA